MLSSQTYRELETGIGSSNGAMEIEKLLLGFRPFGVHYYVSTYDGNDTYSGLSPREPLLTMSRALTLARTHDTIFFVGNIREELTGSNLYFDIAIIGLGGTHHPDQPGTAPNLYNYGAACWRPPASPTTATPLIKVRGRGWQFHNILFDVPVDAAAIYLERNALSGTSEYDSSHAIISGCRFTDGKVAIENAGGASFVTVKGNQFQRLTESGGAGIKCTSTAVAVPLNWLIIGNHFHNNASHILSSMSYSTIANNIFGRFTATLSVDIDDQPSANQGEYNMIFGNSFTGTYAATAYPPGATGTNEWAGNYAASVSGGVTASDPA